MSYQQFFKKASENARPDGAKISSAARAKSAGRQALADKLDKKATTFKVKNAGVPLAEFEAEQKLRSQVKFTSRKKKNPFPWKAFAGLAISLAGVGTYLAFPEYIEKLASKIEVNAMGGAQAAEGKAAEKSKPAAEKSEKAAAPSEKPNPDHGAEAKSDVPEDLSHFEKSKQRKEELDMREKELSELEEELQKQKVELDKRIVQLEEMRTQIAKTLKDRVEVDQEKVTKLVDLYSNMKPKQAADVIGSINEDLAVEVLAKMKKKNAAEVMNLLPQEKARMLSEKYTGYRRPAAEATK